MNELEKAREEMAKVICNSSCEWFRGFRNCEKWGGSLCDLVIDEIIEILSIKLGSHTIGELAEPLTIARYSVIRKLLKLYDEGKLVKLADEQKLPYLDEATGKDLSIEQVRIVKQLWSAGFKKVEPL